MAKVLGYARVSTDTQDAASQKAVLHQHGTTVIFTDTGNGSTTNGRDQLETALQVLERGDTLLAIHPDQLARDTADLLTIGKRVVEKRAVLRIVDPAIVFDGQDIMAEAMLTLFGMIGKIEKHFIKERQRRGIEAAKAKGVYKGRKPTIDPATIRSLQTEGLGATEIAKRLKIGRASVYRLMKDTSAGSIDAEPSMP